jgi:hypothetical protein
MGAIDRHSFSLSTVTFYFTTPYQLCKFCIFCACLCPFSLACVPLIRLQYNTAQELSQGFFWGISLAVHPKRCGATFPADKALEKQTKRLNFQSRLGIFLEMRLSDVTEQV